MPDIINALFELGGTLAVLFSIIQALKERLIVGLSGLHVAFFTFWGVWNCFYYPHLGQWWSFAAGVAMTITNLTYATLWVKYRRVST